MKYWLFILIFPFFFATFSGFSQENVKLVAVDTIAVKINPLAPAKAAFFSAILPGLGQAYNKKYWKIPIVYAALGTSIYAYVWNKKKYNQYREAYKERLQFGTKSQDPYNNPQGLYLSDNTLILAQKSHQRNKDLSLLITIGLYVLNIVDANVDGHLKQFNVNDKLTIKPDVLENELSNAKNLGLTFSYRF